MRDGGLLAQSDEFRRVADESFALLRDRLRPFVEERFRQTFADSWRQKIGLDRQKAVPLGRGTNRGPNDPDHLLGLITSYWDVFARFLDDDAFAPRVRSYAYELRQLRADDYHHVAGFAARDAWRSIDSSRRLLEAFGLLDEPTAAEFDVLERKVPLSAGSNERDLDGLRQRYLATVAARYEFINLGGISPMVGSRVVRLPLDDAYVEAAFDPGPPPRSVPPDRQRSPLTQDDLDDYLADLRQESVQATEASVLSGPRVVVIGGPGSGKSTFVRHAVRQMGLAQDQGNARTPIVIAAPSAAGSMGSSASWSLARYIDEDLSDEFSALLGRDLRSARASLFVDGLDEIAEAGARARFAQAVDAFATEYPRVPIIVTTRPVGYRDAPLAPLFSVFRIRPLDDAQVERFLAALARSIASDDESPASVLRLLDEIRATPGARELAGTPLLLTIIALLWQRGGALPERRIELLEVATQTLLRQWPLQHGFGLDEYDLRAILEPVAAKIVTGDGAPMHRSELRRLVADVIVTIRQESVDQARGSAEELLRVIEVQTGFFVEQGLDAGEPVYGFIHRSFAEYLAARHLFEERAAGRVALADFAFDERWGDAVRLFFAHASRAGVELASGLLTELLDLEPPYDRHLHRGLILALSVLVDHVRVRPTVAARVVGDAVGLFLTTPYDPLASTLRDLLVDIAGTVPDSTSPIRFLEGRDQTHDFPMRREFLAWILGDLTSTVTVRPLVERVSTALNQGIPSAWGMLEDVINRLQESGEAGVATAEVGDTGSDPSPVAVLWSLGDIPHSELIPGGLNSRPAVTLLSSGLLACSIADLVHHGGLPPGFGADPWMLDTSDRELLGVDDIAALWASPETSQAVVLMGVLRDWTEAELESMSKILVQASSVELTTRYLPLLVFVLRALSEATLVLDRVPVWLEPILAAPPTGWARAFAEALANVLLTLPRSEGATDWTSRAIEGLLLNHGPQAAFGACRAIQTRYLDALSDSAKQTAYVQAADAGVTAALLVIAEDHQDPDLRADARRALALLQRPSDLVMLFGEDGISRPLPHEKAAGEPFTAGAAEYSALVYWLVTTAASHPDLEASTAIATQLKKVLTWKAVPRLETDSAVFAFVLNALARGQVQVHEVFREAVWGRIPSVRAEERQWAAAAWACCARTSSAANELAILMGDGDESVRAIGAAALRDVDIGNGSWLGDALEPILRAGKPSPMDDVFDTEQLFEVPEALASIRDMAAHVLDDGVESLAAFTSLWFLADRHFA
jgi:hypothetical protein